MKRKLISFICLMVILLNSVVNVYATTTDNNDNKPKQTVTTNNLEFIKINDTVEIEKDITMTLYLDNIEYDNFTFKLYSSNALENVNAKDVDLKNYNNEEISFDYCINCSNLKTITLNYKLPTTIQAGDTITLNVQLINKDNTEEYKNVRKTVTVIETVKKEETNSEKELDKQEENNKQKGSFSRSTINFSGSIPSGSKTNSNTSSVSTKYKGSSNNYLSNITVKGYKLNKTFTKERLTYFVTVPNNIKSVNISTSKESSSASVNISGNTNLSVGLNKVLIKVTAEDGRVKNYRIYVTRLDSDKNE